MATTSPLFEPDLDLTRDAIASSTLSHGLMVLGDRWTAAVLLGAFTGVNRFELWRERLAIPRSTLTDRLKNLVALGLLRQRPYQEQPRRMAYHLTRAGLQLYDQVLMIWSWEQRWGNRRASLPPTLLHAPCGKPFEPVLSCSVCQLPTSANDLRLALSVNQELLQRSQRNPRTARIAAIDGTGMGLGLRVDRWSLLIINAINLGCHYFDQLCHVLGIASSVLSRRLSGMVQSGLLVSQSDRNDARRMVYRLTPASRDLFGYLVCFASWAGRDLLHQPSSIRPTHKTCGKPFVPQVVCSACGEPVRPWDVSYRSAVTPVAQPTREPQHAH